MYQQQPWMQQQMAQWQDQAPALPYQMPQQQFMPGTPMPPPPGFAQQQFPPLPTNGMLPLEQSYIENILRLNRGKVGTFYLTFENNVEWNARVFRGVVEEAGRDHIIISDPQEGRYFLLLMINLDYVTFDEPLEYDYPFNGAMPFAMATYSPR